MLLNALMCVARTFSETLNQSELAGASWGVPRPRNWHALDAAVAVSGLGVEPEYGLETSEVNRRRLCHGPNALQKIRPRPAWRLLVDQFASIVIALLAAVVAWLVYGSFHFKKATAEVPAFVGSVFAGSKALAFY